jgi:protein disulfide-isomerase
MKVVWLLVLAGALSAGGRADVTWLTDFREAKRQAAQKNVPILANFSGSDWCGWCIKLDREVFSRDEFNAFAKENVVLFMADFPRTGKQPAEVVTQNEKLAEEYGVSGFPTILLLNAEGKVLGRTGYRPGGPADYVAHLKGIMASDGKPGK